MDDSPEYLRYPGRQNGTRDAIDFHADDFAFDGQEASQLIGTARISNLPSRRESVLTKAPQ
jgi:hypothetical protein